MPDHDPSPETEPFTDADMQYCLNGIKKIEEAWNNANGEVPLNFRYEFDGRISRREEKVRLGLF